MSDNHDPKAHAAGEQPDDLLERSIAAMRNAEPVPPGPSAGLVADTLAALRRAAGDSTVDIKSSPRPPRRGWAQRVLAMTFAQRLAAAVMLTIGGMVMWFMFTLFSATATYAQVVAHIRSFHTMTMSATVTLPNQKEPTTIKMMFKDPGRLRHEMPGGAVTITDQGTGQTLVLNPKDKTAQLIKVEGHQNDPAGDLVGEFRKLADAAGEAVGEREIKGVKAKGFKVTQAGHPVTVWADAKTGMPLQVEMSLNMGEQPLTVVMSDIVFDSPLDEALFSLEPPKDYSVNTSTLQVNLNLEENAVTILRAYADANEGRFPASLTDMAEMVKGLHIEGDKSGNPRPEMMKVMGAVGAMMGSTFALQKGTDYDYTPGDAKLGDKDKIVFWCHGKEKGTYRAVYGDLSVKDATAGELGVKLKPEQTTK